MCRTVVRLDRSEDSMIVSALISNKLIQKGLDLRCEQSVTVLAWSARIVRSGFCPAGVIAPAGLRW